MSALSMTGFGRGTASIGICAAEVEISSVNRKQLDFSISLPPGLAQLDEQCRKLIAAKISRGSVRLTVTAENISDTPQIDKAAIKRKAEQLKAVAEAAGIDSGITLADLLRDPGFFAAVPTFRDPQAAWPSIEKALLEALESHTLMRKREGAALGDDLKRRIQAMRTIHEKIAVRAPLVPKHYRDALLERISTLSAQIPQDDPGIAREVALFADKCDISEELTRLATHLDHAVALLDDSSPSGRKLDFLAQEMNRECNTIGSKANDAQITTFVIEAKALVETFREQVQNLE